jgi:hypothetical protein
MQNLFPLLCLHRIGNDRNDFVFPQLFGFICRPGLAVHDVAAADEGLSDGFTDKASNSEYEYLHGDDNGLRGR